jgi:PHP family Zn ribbon phosphoesterase
MATFEAQVEGLTSLSIDGSSAPTQSELSQFLTDGAKEILNVLPDGKKRLYTTSNNLNSSSTNLTIGGSKILSVTRDDGTINQPCRVILPEMSGRASDSDDMNAASATDPVYYISNNILSVIPEPSNSNNAHVQTLAYPTVAYGDDSITKFPDEAEYLVPIYASIKAFQNVLGNQSVSLNNSDDISTALSACNTELDKISTDITIPVAPALHTINYTDASVTKADISGDVPTYTKPGHPTQVSFEDFFSTIDDGNPFGDSDPGVFSTSTPPTLGTASFTTPAIGDITIGSFGTAPAYTAPKVGGATEELTASISDGTIGTDGDFQDFSDWFEVLGHMIEDEEDIELAGSQLQKINSYISAYQQALQNQLNVFNDANVEYQATIQKQIEQSRLDAQDAQQEAALKLQKEVQEYQANVSEYQAEVNKDVQTYSQKLDRYKSEINLAFQAWSKTESDNLQVFQLDIQNELNEFNKENVRYQANVQAELAKHNSDLQISLSNSDKNMQKLIQENNLKIQKYSNELQSYQANVGSLVQSSQGYLAEVQSRLTVDTAKYSWYEKQQAKLQADYDKGLQILGGA